VYGSTVWERSDFLRSMGREEKRDREVRLFGMTADTLSLGEMVAKE